MKRRERKRRRREALEERLRQAHERHERMMAARAYGTSCPRPDKTRYDTAAEAGVVLARMRRQDVRTWRFVNIYECRCGWWHLGNFYIISKEVQG